MYYITTLAIQFWAALCCGWLQKKSFPPPGDFIKRDLPQRGASPSKAEDESDKNASRPDRAASVASSRAPLIDNEDGNSDNKQSVCVTAA